MSCKGKFTILKELIGVLREATAESEMENFEKLIRCTCENLPPAFLQLKY